MHRIAFGLSGNDFQRKSNICSFSPKVVTVARCAPLFNKRKGKGNPKLSAALIEQRGAVWYEMLTTALLQRTDPKLAGALPHGFGSFSAMPFARAFLF